MAAILISAGLPGAILLLASAMAADDARPMQVMALTGGIASGKSTVCRFLKEFLPDVV
jgi:tRNA A37 threonylcarbamoyladenosine biosynthesis protein TsaE